MELSIPQITEDIFRPILSIKRRVIVIGENNADKTGEQGNQHSSDDPSRQIKHDIVCDRESNRN